MSAVMGSALRPGDLILMPSDGYYTARMLAEGYFAEMKTTTPLKLDRGNSTDMISPWMKLAFGTFARARWIISLAVLPYLSRRQTFRPPWKP